MEGKNGEARKERMARRGRKRQRVKDSKERMLGKGDRMATIARMARKRAQN